MFVGGTGVGVGGTSVGTGVSPSTVGTGVEVGSGVKVGSGVAVGSGVGEGGIGVSVGVGGGGFGVGVGNISISVGIVAAGLGSAISTSGEGSGARLQPTTRATNTSIQIQDSFFINDTPFESKNSGNVSTIIYSYFSLVKCTKPEFAGHPLAPRRAGPSHRCEDQLRPQVNLLSPARSHSRLAVRAGHPHLYLPCARLMGQRFGMSGHHPLCVAHGLLQVCEVVHAVGQVQAGSLTPVQWADQHPQPLDDAASTSPVA